MVQDLCKTAPGNNTICVKSINGMNSVEFEAEIREEYWKKFSAEKPTTKAPTTRMKTVAVASDLALWEENETFVLGEAKEAKKKEIFLRTPLNIEMKQAGLLNWKQNRSALTQLSLQALARCKSRAEAAKDHKSMFHSEEEVFSILTDCTTLYVAAALCWTCAHPDMAAPFDEAWNCQEQEDTKCDAIEPYSKAEEATDRSNLDKSRIRLPNGRSLEQQEIFDMRAYRFCEHMGHFDTSLRVPSSNGVRQQNTLPHIHVGHFVPSHSSRRTIQTWRGKLPPGSG